ncbi:hypothetical protein SBA1_930001 [Candidatus Sulfotelmatobacter kueseliae]|uniref:Uncharacterized protein n=1 Tax=Candidatus Sulfotelmatobacter kueseliae TaxID=2042962 RepID=A0A2U3LD00_9BACT|nr:hypothetical protein SBA1_930001 [Candidatus Sulfotelmatobacter kueseliae]
MRFRPDVDVQHTYVAFAATARDVTKLGQLVGTYPGKVTVEARCRDGLKRSFGTLEELLGYENPVRAAITRLEFSANSSDGLLMAEVILGSLERFDEAKNVWLSGKASNEPSFHARVAEILDGMRPWYSRIAKLHVSTVGFYLLLPAYGVLKYNLHYVDALALIGAVAVIGPPAWCALWLRRLWFPVSTFAIGQGLERHKRELPARWLATLVCCLRTVSKVTRG